MELVSLILLITLFLCIGSFSSVVIYRLILIEFSNTNINLFKPRSHCPKCKKNISLIHLIPLVGYLLQSKNFIQVSSSWINSCCCRTFYIFLFWYKFYIFSNLYFIFDFLYSFRMRSSKIIFTFLFKLFNYNYWFFNCL